MIGLSLYLAALLASVNVSTSAAPAALPAVVSSVQMNATEQKFVDLVNQRKAAQAPEHAVGEPAAGAGGSGAQQGDV